MPVQEIIAEAQTSTPDGNSNTAANLNTEAVASTHEHDFVANISGGTILEDEDIPTPPPSSSSSISPPPVPASRSYELIISGGQPKSSDKHQANSVPGENNRRLAIPAKPKADANTPKKFTRLDELNWFDHTELVANNELLDPSMRHLLTSSERKRTEFPDGFDKGNYFETIYPLIASNSSRAPKIVNCGNFFNGRRKPCEQWALCSKCAYKRGLDSSLMYAPGYKEHRFLHLTCSFNGSLPFHQPDHMTVRDYWDANTQVLREMLNEGWFEGAHIVHELKLHSFLPVRVTPHSHIVLACDTPPFGLIPALEEKLKLLPQIELAPSIHLRRIDNQRDLDRVLKYQTESIDLKDAYELAWFYHVNPETRKGAPALNLQMKNFLDDFLDSVEKYSRLVRLGNLMSQHKSYIGMLKKDIPRPNARRRRQNQC